MKKGHSFIHKLAPSLLRVLPVVVLIGLIVSVQSYARDYVREKISFSQPLRELFDHGADALSALERLAPDNPAKVRKRSMSAVAAPVVGTPLTDKSGVKGDAFAFTIPGGTFTDADGDTLRISASLSNGDPLPAWLTFASAAFSGNLEAAGVFPIKVTATDGVDSVSTGFNLTVTEPVVNKAPVFASASYSFTKTDDAPVGTEIGTVTASDTASQTIAYNFESGNGSGTFQIASNGSITLAKKLNYSVDSVFSLTVKALDNGVPPLSATATVTVHVKKAAPVFVNKAPVFASATYSFTKVENIAVGTEIGSVSAADTAGQTIAFSIVNGDSGGKFAISASGVITLAKTVSYPGDSLFNLTVQATDNGTPALSSTASVAVHITKFTPANNAPVVAAPIGDKTATAGTAFSYQFPAGTFTDADNDVLTYTATLADNSALPAWLTFTAGTRTFSGTPSAAATYSIKLRANDGKTSTSTTFGLAVAAAPVAGCSPYSTLPCDQLAVSLPFTLNFTGSEGGMLDKNGAGIGFTMADPYTGTRSSFDGAAPTAVIGYLSSKLAVTNGVLALQTNRGINFSTNNNQINALGVKVPSSGVLTLETTIINPLNGSSSEQGGLWFGINDKNFVKLIINANKVELRKEVGDQSSDVAGTGNTDQRTTSAISGLNNQTVRLRMVVDMINNRVEGFYSIDGTTYVNVGANYTSAANPSAIDIANLAFGGKAIYGGIFATQRNRTTEVTYNFDNFSVKQSEFPVVTAPYRINAGGIQRTSGGNVFSADNYYAIVPGETSNSNYALTGVSTPELYYERRFGTAVKYYIPIANGKYTVKLHMVENFASAAGARVFDVSLEGTKVLTNYDIYVAGGNKNKVLVINTLNTQVNDGVLNIDFAASVDKALINAIEILPFAEVNKAPVFASASYSFSKTESTAVGAEIGTVAATDTTTQTVSYSITAGNAANKFAINASSGVITLANAFNYATDSLYTLTVQATDNGTPAMSATAQVAVRVTKAATVNKAPVFASSSYSFSKIESAAVGSEIGTVAATDTVGQAVSYAITAGNAANKFAINASSGVITLANALSYAADSVYTLTITATDNGSPVLAATATVTVKVTKAAGVVNKAPVFASSSYSFNKDENAATGSVIGTVAATDTTGQTVSYSLTAGNNGNKFAINASSGVITLASALNYATDSVYTLTVTATDNGTPVMTSTAAVTVKVNKVAPVNHAPVVAVAIGSQSGTVGSAFSYTVPAGTFTDSDNDPLTISASLADNSGLPQWLTYNAATSTFTGTPSAVASYTIKLSATDGKETVSTQFALAVNAAAQTGCPPNSTLPCNQVSVTLPYAITFSGAEGGMLDKNGAQLGFTMADAYSGTRVAEDGTASSVIRGYEPSKLTVSGSKLTILTNKGISIVSNNNQINSLGVGFNASAGRFIIETTIVNPYRGANDEQGGLWYGINDQNFVRLSINNNRVVLRKETNDLSPVSSDLNEPNRRNTSAVTNIDKKSVRLRIVVDPAANTVEGFYSVDGVTYVNVGDGYPVTSLDITGMGITGTTAYAGVFATQRTGTTAISYVFDAFSVTPQTAPVNHAPVVANAIDNKNIFTGAAFSFVVPDSTFSDSDGNALTLSATLTDGSALPAWLAFNAATKTFSGTPTAAAVYPIRLTASDGQLNVTTEFTIKVSVPNSAPVVVTAPESQTITAGRLFSFMTGSFSDPDAGDALTYAATLANGTALPAWLQFSAATQTFSGTAPAETGTISVKLTATDKALASVSATFGITIQAAPAVTPCSPISTLPCDQVNVQLPFLITFDGQEGGILAKNNVPTGFTMVDAYTGTRATSDGTPSSAIIGYEPSKLTVANGRLSIATNKGIAYSAASQPNNNQINALGVGFTASGKLIFETTIINPLNGTSSQQAGVWFGLNDKTFVKLVATGNKLELRKEFNDVSSTDGTIANPDQRITDVIAGLDAQTVRLRMVADLTKNTLEGFYSTDGTTWVNVGTRYTQASNPPAINIANMGLSGATTYAGVFATHRNSTNSVTYNFDNFSITKEQVAKSLTFAPNALDFSAVQGQAVTGASTVLSATEGTPAVTFTSSSASWLTLPAATLGTINFTGSNFSSTMAPGIYEAVVTANADGYQPATLIINLTVSSPTLAQEIKVNFQDPATVPPTGWLKDYGQAFGARTGANQGTNMQYGWKKRSDGTLLDLSVGGTIPGNGRKRTTPADITLATLMHMQADDISGTFNGTKVEGYWEIKVPNGSYDVTVSAGDSDPGTVVENHALNVEGVNAFSNFIPSGAAGTATRFKSAKVRVNVTDGFLTINADGGTNTKINSAIITPVSITPYLIWSASEHALVIEKGTAEVNKTFSLDLNHSTSEASLAQTLSVVYGEGASNWLTFDATHNGDEPNVTFDYTAAKLLPVGTYTATVTAAAQGYISAGTLIQMTVLAPGTNQPYVISSTPANGATNVSVNLASIAANTLYVPEVAGFKGGVDNSTLTGNTVKLLKVVGNVTTEITGVVQGTGGGDAISFSPAFALETNTQYRFVITNQVKSYSGAAFLPYEANFTTGSTTTGTPNPVAAEFAPKQVIPGTVGKKYTSLTFGPDGKFYALRLDGVIERFVVDHETGMLSGMVELKALTNKYGARSSVGLTFDPSSTATNLIAWVSHCSAGLSNAPEFDGNISKLSGADLETEQLVLTKLPRSKADHLVNSIAFGPDGALYYNQGSNSSMGLYDGTWQRDESLLSATVMRLDLNKLANLTLPLDVRTTANQTLINTAPADNIRMSDGTYNPYAAQSPLTIFASGVRNAFDLLWHTNGQLYVPANGSAAGGNSPASVAGTRLPQGGFYGGPAVNGTTSVKVQNDWLFRVNPLKPVGYYGHPNPLRGQYVSNRGYLDNPKYPTTQGPDAAYRGAAFNFELNKSPNGVIEYKSNAFNGALKGRILVCRFSGGSDIIVMEPGSMVKDPSVSTADSDDRIYDIIGSQTGSGTDGITGLSGFTNPLDLTEDVQTGNLYVIEYNWNNISGKTAQIVMLKATTPSAQVGIATVSPAEIVDNDVIGGAAGKAHTITIANTGNAALTVTNIALDGVDKSQFQLTGAPTPSVASPVTIARGSAITFNLAFNPSTVGVKKASLLITSANNPVKEVVLSGLGTAGLSGTNEPSLQAVLDVHGINVNVGDDNKATNIIHSTNFKAPLLGEEVSIQSFVRATDGNVIVEPLSVFGPEDTGGIVTGFGYYTTGQPNTKNEVFTVNNANFQTVDPQVSGALSFDPGIDPFGFYSRWPYFNNRAVYSEDAQNTFTSAIPHHVRIYPLKNSDGNLIDNSYIVAFEEHISGFDYQDLVLIVRNVKPAVAVKTLTLSAGSLSLAHSLGSPATPQSVTLSASSGTPVVTIAKSTNSDWLILPSNPAVGPLSFSVNPSGLTAGTYNAIVTLSADGYSNASLNVTLTVTAPATMAKMAVTSEELVFDALKGNTMTKRLTIRNVGNASLRVDSILVTGTNADKFSYEIMQGEDEPSGKTLAPDQTKTVDVKFTPAGQVGTFNGTLAVYSNAPEAPVKQIGLYSLSLNAYEGSNEPPLQTVVNVLGIGISVGWTNLVGGIQPVMKGEEVPVPFFEKAGTGDVTITPVARYSPNQELPFGFYTKSGSTPVRTGVGTLSGVLGQHNALYPQIVAGSDRFDPGAESFGIYVQGLQGRLSYTEDAQNTGGPAIHAARIYPMKDRQGVAIPNSYLICFEDASNGDYQDYMFVVSNVIPAGTRKTLSFDLAKLDFNGPVNGTVAAKTVVLEAKNGTPAAITFSKSNTGWLTVPSPALGTLSFGINTTGLAAGAYTTTVTASADGYTSASLTVNLHITGLSTQAVKVNYQLTTSATPSGYMADTGLPYDDTRGFGWVNPTTKEPKDNSAGVRERTASGVEVRLKTLALMQPSSGASAWEMKVANGQYNVTVGVGDVGFYDSNHRINLEGIPVISSFVPTAQTPNLITTATVNVADGKLTIDATGGTNTKILFVIVDPATPDGDFTPPVASITLKGTAQSSGVYRGQVIATVNASDAGGSNLAQVLYSLNNAPYQAYYSPILLNSAGTYTLRAKAIDGNNNETVTGISSFSVVTPDPSNANMVVENLDKFPANDRLAFSLIQKPWRRTLDDGTFTAYNRNHDVVKVKISNKGTGALTISNMIFSNPTGWKIAQINSVAYDPATAAPITIASGGSAEVAIQFIANYPSGRVRILNDTLNIASNDDIAPKKSVILHGLWQFEGEGNNEPRAVEIIRAFGYKSNVGFTTTDGTNAGTSLILNSDEIISAFWTRADATKPVRVVQMGAYHGCCNATESFQYYVKGSASTSTVFTHNPLDGQSLLPMKNGSSTVLADGTFNPTGIFGFKAATSYSDRTRNTEGKIGMRFWKALDVDGNVIPNTYIIGHDYIGKPGITNYDYQDNVYYITNIKPEIGATNYSELADNTASTVEFGSVKLGGSDVRSIELKNLGRVYDNGTSDPAITIQSVEIVGANQNEFAATTPVALTLNPQGTTTMTVSFRPNTKGIKNAALMVKYNNSLSPLRIPIYAIADDNCNVIAPVKRIKGGSDAAVTINGKTWEADKPYRAGSIQLDKPAATAIAGTDDDVLYQTYLSASADLAETRYSVPVANGSYMVRMHFIENFFTASGSRVFGVNIENQNRLTNFDIFREVGYKAAVVKDFEVTITDGKLDVKFNPAANRVALAGMEIFASSASPTAITLTQQSVLGAECGVNNGSITFGVANSSATSFLYKMGANGTYQSSPTFTNLASGENTFYVKENSAGGCETSKVFNIPQRNNMAFNVSAIEMACTATSTSATVSNITGGLGTYTITWGTNPIQTGATATGLIPGVYTVTVLDVSGCSKAQDVTVTRAADCGPTTLRINSGGAAYAATGNRQFIADAYYGGTDRVQSIASGDILKTTDDVLYRSERSADAFNYRIPVTNGTMNVILHFAETYFKTGGTGKRQFNVDIEGARKLTNYDVFAKAGAGMTAVQETFTVTVTDQVLNIDFSKGAADLPKICAIEVVPQVAVVNVAPVLVAIGNKTATVGSTLTFTAAASDANAGQTLTYSIVDAPAGATINATTGAFTWTPSAAGTATFTVRVTDNGSPVMTDEKPVNVTINAAVALTTVRINAGGAAFAASGGRQFMADNYYGGTDRTTSITSGDILNTTDDQLYYGERSAAVFNYSIPVANGTMNVILHFAETWWGITGKGGTTGLNKRRFNIDVEGSRKATNYDIFAKAGGAMRAIQETYSVTVTDGMLNLNFTSGASDFPTLSAIEVVPQSAATNVAPVLASIGSKTATVGQPLTFTATATDADAGQTLTYSLVNAPSGAAINATSGAFSWTPSAAGTVSFSVRVTDNGSPVMSNDQQVTVTSSAPVAAAAVRINSGGAAFAATGNRQFIADTYFGGTDRTGTITSGDILNTTDDRLYYSERSSEAFSYSIPVTNGSMNVILHFAETWWGITGRGGTAGTGKRQFHVDIEGSRKLTNYDIFTKAGGAMRAVQETIAVTVTDGVLNLNFTKGAADLPKISAIEVIPAGTASGRIGLETSEVTTPVYEKSMVYPNPVHKRFTLEISGQHKGNVTLKMINNAGITYDIRLTEPRKGGEKAEVDISNLNLARGTHLLKVQSASATEIIRVLITE